MTNVQTKCAKIKQTTVITIREVPTNKQNIFHNYNNNMLQWLIIVSSPAIWTYTSLVVIFLLSGCSIVLALG